MSTPLYSLISKFNSLKRFALPIRRQYCKRLDFFWASVQTRGRNDLIFILQIEVSNVTVAVYL